MIAINFTKQYSSAYFNKFTYYRLKTLTFLLAKVVQFRINNILIVTCTYDMDNQIVVRCSYIHKNQFDL